MLTRTTLTVSAAACLSVAAVLTAPAAHADLTINVTAGDPGTPATLATNAGGGGGGGKGTSSAGKCRYDDKAIPCSTSHGTWYASKGCWAKLADPQPPTESTVWDGHTDGAVYLCVPPFGPGFGGGGAGLFTFWAPAGITAALVDPEVLARRAVDSMRLVGLHPR